MSEEVAAFKGGELCLGCSSTFAFKVETLKKIARIFPGCSHNLCEQCIVTEGTNTGQVCCLYPGCSNHIPWSGKLDEFLPNIFILGSTAYQESSSSALIGAAGVSERTDQEEESQETRDVICEECEEKKADCYCQNCEANFCCDCFENIHKSAKSLMKHKSLSLVVDTAGRKVLELMKIPSCSEHGKKVQYVTEDGSMGCEECVAFGKLAGLKVESGERYNEEGRFKMKEKIGELKDKFDRLNFALVDLKSDKVENDKLSKNIAKDIKSHFVDCHSQLQALEHDLHQKLEKEITTRNTEIDSMAKSISEKANEVSSFFKIAEEAMTKDSCSLSYSFDQMIDYIDKFKDPSGFIKKKISKSPELKIEVSFLISLKNHISLIDAEESLVNQTAEYKEPASNKPSIESPSSGKHLNTLDQVNDNSEKGREAENLVQTSSVNEDIIVNNDNDQFGKQVDEDLIENGGRDEENVIKSANILEKGKAYSVLVPDITDPGEMCVQVVAIGEDRSWGERLENLCNQLQEAYKDFQQGLQDPKIGTICIAKFSVDEKFYRAQVVRLVRGGQVEIHFLDFGNSEVTDRSNLRPILPQFLNVPVLSIKVALSDVVPIHGNSFNEESAKALKQITEYEELEMFVDEDPKEGTPLKVALYKITAEKDIGINAWIVKEGLAKSATGLHTQVEYLKLDTIPVKETTNQTVVNSQLNLMGPPEESKDDCAHDVCEVQDTDLVKEKDGDYRNKDTVKDAECQNKDTEKDAEYQNMDTEKDREYHIYHAQSPSMIYVLSEKEGEFDPSLSKKVHLSDIRPTGGTFVWSNTACEYLREELEEAEDIVTLVDDGEKVVDEELGINSQPVKIMIWKRFDEGPFNPQGREQVSLSQRIRDEGLALPANSSLVKSALLVPQNRGHNLLSFPSDVNPGRPDVPSVIRDYLDSEVASNPNSSVQGLDWIPASPLEQKHFIGTPTHVDWNCTISIQTVQNKENVKKIIEVLNSKYSRSCPEPHDLFWFAGQPCIAQFEVDKNWSRGRIVKSVEPGVFEVDFVDFGNPELMKPNELRKKLFCQDEPVQCFQFQLVDIVPKSEDKKWSKKILDFIHKLVVEQTLEVSITSELADVFPVKGRLTTLAGVDISELLVKNGYAAWENGSSTQLQASSQINQMNQSLESFGSFVEMENSVDEEMCTASHDTNTRLYPKYQPNELPGSYQVGVDFPVLVLGQAGCDVNCHLVPTEKAPELLRNLQEFSKMQEQLQALGDGQERAEQPTVGQAVIARYSINRKWFRAVVINESPLKVYFVDYGNDEETQEVKLLPEGFEELPEQVVFLQTVSKVNLDDQDLSSPEGYHRCRLLQIHRSSTSRKTVATVEFITWASK